MAADKQQPWGATDRGVAYGLAESARTEAQSLIDGAASAAHSALLEVEAPDFYGAPADAEYAPFNAVTVTAAHIRRSTEAILARLDALDAQRRHRLIARDPLRTARDEFYALVLEGSSTVGTLEEEAGRYFDPFSNLFPELSVARNLESRTRKAGDTRNVIIADRSKEFGVYGSMALRAIIAGSRTRHISPRAS